MHDRAPHTFHPDTPRPALPTARTSSHRSGLLALLVVAGLFATLAGLWVLDVQRQTDETNAEAAAAMVRSVANRVNAGAPMPDAPQVEAVAIALREEQGLHSAASVPVTTTIDLPATSEVEADAAYLVEVGGELGCLLLRGDRADAYADGRNVTDGGTSPLLPDTFDCASLRDA